MAKNTNSDLKEIYDKVLADDVEKDTPSEQKTKAPKSKKNNGKKQEVQNTVQKNEKPDIKAVLNRVVAFVKANYISVELMLAGFVLLCLGLLPAIKIISYQFLETLNASVNYFHIAGWIFSFGGMSAENVFLSLFSGLYILSALAMIIVGVLILTNVIKKKQFMINSIMHLITLVAIMCFFVCFAVWMSKANDANLIATGVDIIYYNFSTIKIHTLVYFNLSFNMIAYTVLYAYHNRQSIFSKKK